MKENGKTERKMDLVFWNFLKNNIIKELLLNQLKMDMEFKSLSMAINTKANIEKGNSMVKENIHGQTPLCSKAIFMKVWDMETEPGSLLKLMVIFM